jgi:hypothetical protein
MLHPSTPWWENVKPPRLIHPAGVFPDEPLSRQTMRGRLERLPLVWRIK